MSIPGVYLSDRRTLCKVQIGKIILHLVIMHTVVQESTEGRKGKCNGEA